MPSKSDLINIIFNRGVAEVIEEKHLEKRLRAGEKLRVKLGIDPTMPNLHLGHAVVLRKLRQFQEGGHQAVFIVGDFTATIGDPSGRSEQRPQLTKEEIEKNMKNYVKEAGKILDVKRAEIRYNSEWYLNKGANFFMELAGKFTVARLLERDDFQKRLREDRDISVLEVYYSLMQGYDSVAVKADVELGGVDQKFNLLMGRRVQKRYGLPEQDVVTTLLLEGTDGVKKMSKSFGNYIGLSEQLDEMFGKIMSISDDLMTKYFTLLTDVRENEIEQLRQDRLRSGSASRSPKEWKETLAFEVVKMCHGEDAAKKAKEEFRRVFSRDELPQDIPFARIRNGVIKVVDLLVESGLAHSKSEARGLIEQGGVRIDGKSVSDQIHIEVKEGMVVQVGKRKFAKIKPA